MDEGKPSVLARLFVLDKADVARREVGERGECRQYGFNSGLRGDVPQDDCCQNMQTRQCECKKQNKVLHITLVVIPVSTHIAIQMSV